MKTVTITLILLVFMSCTTKVERSSQKKGPKFNDSSMENLSANAGRNTGNIGSISLDPSKFVVTASPSFEEENDVVVLDQDIYEEIQETLEVQKNKDITEADYFENDANKYAYNEAIKSDIYRGLASSFEEYTTENSRETLMLISFKLYGDYGNWRTILDWNPELKGNYSSIKKGTVIKYQPLESGADWPPKGSPYLVRRGDTLGRISNNVYKTPKLWGSIWENNKPLIKDPNLIFAGFTLYYLPKELIR
jgi:nucleoid-associated protein YgaU